MSLSFIGFIVIAVLGALALAGVVRMILWAIQGRKAPAPEAPPMPTSLSFLAGLSFFSGLGAICLVVSAAILFTTLSMGQLLQLNSNVRDGLTVAAKIVLYVSLLPSVVAVAFALAARGVISEGSGAVRGKPLYRTGVLLAVLSGAVVFDARVVNPATWTSAGRSVIHGGIGAEDVNRGFLGVETGPLDSEACIRLTRVVPGSPADRAGLKAGDRVTKIDGMAVYQLPPAGRPSERSYSPGSTEPYIGSYIGALSPGTRVSVEVRRGRETVTIVAELSASFASLLTLLQTQSFDAERLAVLKAAGLDRRYSAEELTKICGTFDFDDGRLKVIEQTLPLLQDPKNAYRILSALDSSASKSKVSGWIGERAKSSTPSRDE